MLLIMRNFFIKTIVVSFCFVSFNSHAVESIYLICENNYKTTVFGFVVSLRNKAQALVGYDISATGYKADSSGNEFINKSSEYTDDAMIYENQLIYSDYEIDRVTGELTEWWLECPDEDRGALCLAMDQSVRKSKVIGSCNKVSESEAKAKAKQLYKPTPQPKKKF